MLMKHHGIKVLAASVDPLAETIALVEGLRLRYVQCLAELDGPLVAKATGAQLHVGETTFLHATGFLLRPDGQIETSVYATGPIGRFSASDILKKVIFSKVRASGQS